MRIVVILALAIQFAFISCTPVFAQDEFPDNFELPELSESSAPANYGGIIEGRKFRYEISVGTEARAERSVGSDQRDTFQSTRFGFGFSYSDSWLFQTQYGELNESTRSGSLIIDSSTRELMLLASYLSTPNNWWTPVVGGGIGGYQDLVETRLSGFDSNESRSDPQLLAQAHGGFRFQVWNLYFQFQGNLLKKEANPSVDFSFSSQLGLQL